MEEKHIITNLDVPERQRVGVTEEELRRDYRYRMALRFTEKLLAEGRITPEEYEKICREHIKNFRPTLAPIMP